MNLFYRSILPLFATIAFWGVFLISCASIPDYPEAAQTVESVNIIIQQKGKTSSAILKVNPSDSATIKASVFPEKFIDDISFEWMHANESKDSLLGHGIQYSFFPNKNSNDIPNKLIASDKEGNQKTFDFTIIINTPPELAKTTIPANGDTLYGTSESAFLFEWYSGDLDLSNGDSLFHILEIDDKPYDVGTLQQVKQSGFKAGEHKFRIIVRDLYGDKDSLAYKTFYVVDTLEVK